MSEEATPMRINRPGRADDLAVRVSSPTERMRLGVGACRRLDGALIDRQVLLACAAEFSESPSIAIGVRRIARLVGVPSEVVWEVVARHSLLDDPLDQWVIFAYTSPWDDDGRPAEPGPPPPAPPEGLIGVWGCSDLSLRLTYPEWPIDFIDLGLRRWTDDLLALAADLVARAWGPFGDRYQAAAWFLGEVFECLEPEWSLHLWADGMQRVHGNLAARAVEMPSRRVVPHRDHDPVRACMLPESVRVEILERFARRLLALDLGCLPERIFDCPPEDWGSAGQLLCVLFKGVLPGVGERLEERLFRAPALLDLMAAIAACDPDELEDAVGLIYDMTTGVEGGARRFVKALNARRAYELPYALRKALVERLSMGLGGIVEAVDTADPDMGLELMGVFKRWREELGRFRWLQSVGWDDPAVLAARYRRRFELMSLRETEGWGSRRSASDADSG